MPASELVGLRPESRELIWNENRRAWIRTGLEEVAFSLSVLTEPENENLLVGLLMDLMMLSLIYQIVAFRLSQALRLVSLHLPANLEEPLTAY